MTGLRPALLPLWALACLARPAPAQDAPKIETVAIPGTRVAFDLVYVPGGTARVGSPDTEPGREKDEAVREVALSPFWIGVREVTWEEYSLYYESWKQEKVDGVTRPSQPDVVDPKEPFPNGAEQSPRHPAVAIGWFGAQGYCEWLSKKTGHRYRLPTEAEWEYACRAGSAAPHPEPLDDHAWHKANSDAQTHPVGEKKPNAFGLRDVLGNVWEQCLEPYAPPAFGPVVRGGAWNTPPGDVRAANRQTIPDEWAERDPKRPLRLWWITDGPFVGFRVVRLPDPESPEEREAAARVEVRDLKVVQKGKRPDYLDRVAGEVVYTGKAPLAELEVTVFFLDEDGKPMPKDPKDKPAFNKAYPALAHSYHAGDHRKPLRPGESRKFELDVPHPFIEAGPLDLDKVAAKVTRVVLARQP
jgi:formylglycine-generating enzyme required for sulfatase activity